MEERIKELEELVARLQIKADQWDALDEKIGEFYLNDESEDDFIEDDENWDVEGQGDLCDIGELAAIAFGYL